MILTIIFIGSGVYAGYRKARNPYWTPFSSLFATPHELREALGRVRTTSVPTPTPSAALDPNMSSDQAQAINAVLVSETDPQKIADHAKAAKAVGLENTSKALTAKAEAIGDAKAKGATESDIKKEQVAAATTSATVTGAMARHHHHHQTSGPHHHHHHQTSGPADCGPAAYWDPTAQRCVPLSIPTVPTSQAPSCPPGSFFDYLRGACVSAAVHTSGAAADCGPTSYWDPSTQRCIPLSLPPAPTTRAPAPCPPGSFYDYFKQACTPATATHTGWEPWEHHEQHHEHRPFGFEQHSPFGFGRPFGFEQHSPFGFGREHHHEQQHFNPFHHGFEEHHAEPWGRDHFGHGEHHFQGAGHHFAENLFEPENAPFEHDRLREHHRRFGRPHHQQHMRHPGEEQGGLPICTPHDIALGRAGVACQSPETVTGARYWGERPVWRHRFRRPIVREIIEQQPVIAPVIAPPVEVVEQVTGPRGFGGGHGGFAHGGFGHGFGHHGFGGGGWGDGAIDVEAFPIEEEVVDASMIAPPAVVEMAMPGPGWHGWGHHAHGGWRH